MLGQHCLRAWSSTQSAIALSSAEAELYAMLDAALRGKGVRNTASEVGMAISEPLLLYTDSAAAKTFVSKRGLGDMRHLELRHLWLQREANGGQIAVGKVLGTENPADLLTKFLSKQDIADRLSRLSLCLNWAEASRDA